MSAQFLGTLAVIILAMGFNYTNGFHDAANAIATSVSTRALTPKFALGMAAVGNLFGSFLGAKVAATVGKGVISGPTLAVVGAGLVGAITWNLATWYFGIPSSSSQALIGGLVGAALAGGVEVLWGGIAQKILLPMVISPLVGLTLGALVMVAVMWIFRRGHPGKLNRGFRFAQTISALGMSIGHGMQDAAKTMGIVVLALYTGGFQDDLQHIPWWVYWLTAAVLAAGTYSGGWRIIRTLGRKVIDLGPPQGFAAETAATTVLAVSAAYGLPISTTHTITSAIMGVGATKRISAVRWGVAGNIVTAWILTFPAAALVAALAYGVAYLFM
ncbi:MAG: inorganic phosphate transporter [Longispora sp.]|nr:inorganic phosphate transporter [Longispora sp. (in: high G+C Gram-positive bacteria)]